MFFFNKNKDKKEYYFGLFLKSSEATGFVFEITKNNHSILAQQTVTYSNGWENIVQDIDEVLSKLEKTTRLHLKKVIFFVYSYFISGNEIRQPYKTIIKSLSKDLDLTPLGYIECNEAVAQYLQRRDKSPLNVILVEIDKQNVDVCIYKGSRKVSSKTISRTSILVDDLTSVFTEIKGQILLPSRLVLYDSSDLDDESVKILSHKWDKDIFIQHPRVEVIKEQDLHAELANIFFTQLHQVDTDTQLTSSENVIPEEPVEEVNSPHGNVTPTAIGQPMVPPVNPEVLGFTVHDDTEPIQSTFQTTYPATAAPSATLQSSPPETVRIAPKKGSKFVVPKMSMMLPKLNIIRFALIFGIVLIIISLFLIESYFHKATLTIILPSKTISKKTNITDLDIKTSTISTSIDGTVQTTGKRDIGEKARGVVTVHNFEDSEKTFAKGTIIEVEGHSFTFDQDVTIASASETLSGGEIVKTPGKTKTNITASNIGPEGNLEKGKRFKIGTESTSKYFAMNDSALVGGSKKTVKTVAKKDIDDLKKDLLDKATKQAIETIKKTISSDNHLLDTLTEVNITDTTASKEVGEEASQITLNLTISADYYFYDEKDLKNKLAQSLKSDIPSDFELNNQKITYNLEKVEKSADGNVTLSVEAKETASKKINPTEIQSAVLGKNKEAIDAIVKNKTSADGFTIDISAPLPLLDLWMPFFSKNIEVKTTTE